MEANLLLQLPAEIRCEVIQSVNFELEDIFNAMKTSSQLKADFERCLTHVIPENDIGHVTPDFITRFPNLVEFIHYIDINQTEDIMTVAEHPRLRRVYLNLYPMGEKAVEDEFSMSYNQLILLFVEVFLAFHNDLEGISFLFDLHNDERILIENGRLEIYTEYAYELPLRMWNPNTFILELSELMPIRSYSGPIPPPLPELRSLHILIREFTRFLPFLGQPVVRGILGPLLEGYPGLRSFGMDMILGYESRINKWMKEAFESYNVIDDLEGFVFPAITQVNVFIHLDQLALFYRIFPNAREPLIGTYSLTPATKALVKAFAGKRLSALRVSRVNQKLELQAYLEIPVKLTDHDRHLYPD